MTSLTMQLLWSMPGDLLVAQGASHTAQSCAGQIEAELQHSMSPPHDLEEDTRQGYAFCQPRRSLDFKRNRIPVAQGPFCG